MSKITRRTLLAAAAGSPLAASQAFRMSNDDIAFLDELSLRAFRYFLDAADPKTGLVLDRRAVTGGPALRHPNVSSIAATGFGLTAWCIGAERQWIPRYQAAERTRTTMRFFADEAASNHGWFYHFLDATSGQPVYMSEVSSIDTALLLTGMLTARVYFSHDREIVRLADDIFARVDFNWMLNGDPLQLSHGWRPDVGFFRARWNAYCELMVLYLLAIGAPEYAIPPAAWYGWRRDTYNYNQYAYVSGGPLFIHQYSHAWMDLRRRRDTREPKTDWFLNSVVATRAHRAYCVDLANNFPGTYGPNVWGITASDSPRGYVNWGGPPRDSATDGTVVPCAAAGSLMFTPDICVPTLRYMQERFGQRIWGRYGFADAFHPVTGWVSPDVLGIDQGITLLSAENLRSGNIWKWFMRNEDMAKALEVVTASA